MTPDAILALLKVVGAVMGGLLGIAGLLVNFKRRGRLTNGGKVVLTGIVFSAIVGVSTSVVEIDKARKEAAEQALRTETLLHEISKTLQPITKLEATYWIEFPPGDNLIDAYIKRVKEGVDSRIDTLRDIKNFGAYPGLSTPSIDEHGDPIDVEMDKQSDLWPRDAEAIIGQITTILAPSIDLMKAPIDPEKFTGVVGATDFGAYSFTPERVTLQWNRKKSKLYAFGRTEYEKKFWSANGKITSILEFLGAQILITLPGSSNANLFNPIPGMRPPDKQKVDIQRSLLIHTIALSISNGRTIWLRGSQLKRGKYVSGYPVFSFIFPTTEADFKQVTTSSDED